MSDVQREDALSRSGDVPASTAKMPGQTVDCISLGASWTTATPRLLDLYCGEGGAGVGYFRAGFDVLGVDTDEKRLRNYPFACVEGDAIEYLLAHGHEFDAIHASPPCTGYTRGTAAIPDRFERYDRLIGATREALEIVGKPYVIENVADARPELRGPILLCGRMFGLGAIDDDGTPLVLDRHRLFESNMPLWAPAHLPHDRDVQVAGAYGGARRDKHEARHVRKGGYVPPSLDVLRSLVGCDWMTEQGCFLSIPPAYTEFLGKQMLRRLSDNDTPVRVTEGVVCAVSGRHNATDGAAEGA